MFTPASPSGHYFIVRLQEPARLEDAAVFSISLTPTDGHDSGYARKKLKLKIVHLMLVYIKLKKHFTIVNLIIVFYFHKIVFAVSKQNMQKHTLHSSI